MAIRKTVHRLGKSPPFPQYRSLEQSVHSVPSSYVRFCLSVEPNQTRKIEKRRHKKFKSIQ